MMPASGAARLGSEGRTASARGAPSPSPLLGDEAARSRTVVERDDVPRAIVGADDEEATSDACASAPRA